MRIPRILAASFLITISLLLHLGARADTVTIGALKDNTLYEDPDGILSNGAGRYLFAGTTLEGAARRALIAFDIAANVPAGVRVDSVTLSLHMSRSISGPVDIMVHRLLADWGEGASQAADEEGRGGSAAPGDATWKHSFFNTSLWTTAGGDFVLSPSASSPVGGASTYNWSSPALAADVQAWLNSPTSNFGWILKTDELDSPRAKRFDSLQNPTASFRPALTVNFTIPEPASLALLGIALTAVASRRRQAGARIPSRE